MVSWLVFRTVSLVLWVLTLTMIYVGLIQGFDIGWLFIASFTAVAAATFWKNS